MLEFQTTMPTHCFYADSENRGYTYRIDISDASLNVRNSQQQAGGQFELALDIRSEDGKL